MSALGGVSALLFADERKHVPASARLLLALLARMDRGSLELRTPDGVVRHLGCSHCAEQVAELSLHDWPVARDVLLGGDVAFGEAYMDGRWQTPDLVALLRVLAANQRALERAFYARAWQRTLMRFKHWLNANSRPQAKRNVVAHYDLGNDFYALWLDPKMTYSSALFGGDRAQPLVDAQQAKYRRVLDELALPERAHILELGCGWGGFAEMAARAGHRVTALSLSEAQTAFARDRVARAGLAHQVEFRIQDYRDVRGIYDGVASIEMFEAVGERWWPTYFRTVRDVLRPGRRACVQTITIANERFERYRTQSDFIQQYIFPGGMLASPARLTGVARAQGLEELGVYSFGSDYAETLRRWLRTFDLAVEGVRALGFSERFIRCWRFYLAYCAAAFDSGTTDVAQYTLVARQPRAASAR